MLKDQGTYEGKAFFDWVRDLLEAKGIRTFKDLVRRDDLDAADHQHPKPWRNHMRRPKGTNPTCFDPRLPEGQAQRQCTHLLTQVAIGSG
jgi:hypothetical protein